MQQLTAEQRRQWRTDGYLHLEGALDAEQVAFFASEMDRIRRLPGWEPDRNQGKDLPIGHYAWLDHARDLDPRGFMDRRDLLTYHQAFIDLIDAAPVFDYVVDIMGPNILLSMTQAITRPADPKFPGYTHTDGGESLRLTRLAESSPPVALKAMYLLTDVPQENCGNLTVFPGSHLRQIPFNADGPKVSAKPHDALLPRRRAAHRQGRRRVPVPARPVARPVAQRFQQSAQGAALQLLPSYGCAATTTTRFRRWRNGQRPASGACSATWATTSAPGRISTCRTIRPR